MDYRLQVQDLQKPEELAKLVEALSELAEQLDVMYTEAAPDGSISSRQGKIAIYKNGAEYEQWQNTDGATAWQRMSSADLVTGDWISSSVTTARTGWTNVSATYADKFMRVHATPKTTSGADTHTHAAGTFAGASHTHAVGTLASPDHTHSVPNSGWSSAALSNSGYIKITSSSGVESYANAANTSGSPSSQTITGSTAADGTGTITGTSAAGDNVPAYVTVALFEKD